MARFRFGTSGTTPEPERSRSVGTNATAHPPLAASGPYLPSLSFAPSARHHLRQEPYAGNPLVRIRAGGTEQSVSLPRLPLHPVRSTAKNPTPGNHPSGTTTSLPDSGGSAAKEKLPPQNLTCSRIAELQPLRNGSGRHPAQWPMEGPSGAFGPAMNFPTTERTQSITYKSAKPKGMITRAGIHLVVQGTNRINGT